MGTDSENERDSEAKLELEELLNTPSPGNTLTEAQRAELVRRQADLAANPNNWVAWEDVLNASLKRVAP